MFVRGNEGAKSVMVTPARRSREGGGMAQMFSSSSWASWSSIQHEQAQMVGTLSVAIPMAIPRI
jgi:hypothetical protein